MNVARWCLAAWLLLAAAPADAIHMSPDGVGQVLIYPYYTAQATGDRPYNSYISIINHDSRGKALRVRFREGRNGREVASFNLFLDASDAWAGAIVPTFGRGAAIRSVDQSCTAPGFPVDFAPGSVPTLDFTDAAYTGTNGDGFGIDNERMREGYVEVLEMAIFGDITPDPATHCDDFRAERVAGAFDRPVGGLSGTLTLINVADGMDFTVNAVALNDVASQKYYRPANDPYPDFDAAEINKVSAFVQDGKLYRATWPDGVAALEAVLMRGDISNEVVLDAGTASATDWVLTRPTTRFDTTSTPQNPYMGREVELSVDFRPRDGKGIYYVAYCLFLCPGLTRPADIRARWIASVLSFRNQEPFGPTVSDVLGSSNAWSVALPAGTQNGTATVNGFWASGWTARTFQARTIRIDNNESATETVTLVGIPVVGFMVRTFRNGTLKCGASSCQGNYGGSFPHKTSRNLQP